MKRFIILMLAVIAFVSANTFGQDVKDGKINDSTVVFRVNGACTMCKNRIEEALKIHGVSSANWDIKTQMLTLVYDHSVISVSATHKLIAQAGHDTELEKAPDNIYNELPACCLYRDKGNSSSRLQTELEKFQWKDSIIASHAVAGIVLEEDKKGSFRPLAGASVYWADTKQGTTTNSSGVFRLKKQDGKDLLVISYAGYRSDTISIKDNEEIMILLAAGKQLTEVRVVNRPRATYISSVSAIRMQIMNEKELFKAACCNLSESFETNPSVDVSYNDALTGSKQIQLLGLGGSYTLLTVENLPGPRGLATPLGLNFIAGPWIESIQLSKGVGSVVNGFESIAGQINVELKKPGKAEKLYLNTYLNNMGKTDLNLNFAKKISNKWSTALLLHDDFLVNKSVDYNKDGFRDLPTGNQFGVINRWTFEDGKGWLIQFGVKFLKDSKTGGEIDFDPEKDKFTTGNYGLGISSERKEVFGKFGYIFPAKKYKSIGLQLSGIDHRQDSYFGLAGYKAKQHSIYVNLIYQSIIENTNHKFRTGLSFARDYYDELFKSLSFVRTEIIPGAFFEYTFTTGDKLSFVGGLRADHHNLFGWFATPRLHIKYEPVKGSVIRLSAGRGQRTANIFAENMSVFVSARELNIISREPGKAYGLDPEIAWNKGLSFDQKFKLFKRDATVAMDYYRNDFKKQVVVDLEDPRQVKFYDLQGISFSNSLQAEMNIQPLPGFDIRVAYRFFNVKTRYEGRLLQKPFIARHRAFTNLAYENGSWKFDFTLNYIGSKRVPGTWSNPLEHQRSTVSPYFWLMNAQATKTMGKKHLVDIYIGSENIINYFQKDVIIAGNDPFGNYFDASMIWGPVGGRLIYTGLRFKIK